MRIVLLIMKLTDLKNNFKYPTDILGEKADGDHAELEIVEVYIPDVPYTISEYDGYERIE